MRNERKIVHKKPSNMSNLTMEPSLTKGIVD